MEFRELADLFEVAVRIERHSVELYVKLHEKVRSARAKEAFSILAAEEEKHLGHVRVLLEEAADYTPRYVYPGEYELYVDGLASRVLAPVQAAAQEGGIASAEEAIALAVTSEEAATAFYESHAGEFEGRRREMVDMLIAEEKEHLSKLWELLQTYPGARS